MMQSTLLKIELLCREKKINKQNTSKQRIGVTLAQWFGWTLFVLSGSLVYAESPHVLHTDGEGILHSFNNRCDDNTASNCTAAFTTTDSDLTLSRDVGYITAADTIGDCRIQLYDGATLSQTTSGAMWDLGYSDSSIFQAKSTGCPDMSSRYYAVKDSSDRYYAVSTTTTSPAADDIFRFDKLTGGDKDWMACGDLYEFSSTLGCIPKSEPSSHVTQFSASIGTSAASVDIITTRWTTAVDGVIADNLLLLCNKTGNFTAPVDGIVQINDTNCADGTGVINTSSHSNRYYWKNLDENTTYYFTIYPYSNEGTDANYKIDGALTATSTTPTLPDAPSLETATAANMAVLITFVAPDNDGGTDIIDYTASCGSNTVTATESPIMVSGLTNGTEYSCSVTARNIVGNSPVSNTIKVTPTDGGDITLPPSDGGSGEDVSYTYSAEAAEGGGVVASTITITATVNPETPPEEIDSLVAAVDIKSTSPGNNGYTLAVVFKIDASSSSEFSGFWKYGSKSDGGANEWYDYGTKADNNDGTGYEISADKKTLTVYLVDGKLGDNDWQKNAEIVDPALPIVKAVAVVPAVTAIPTLSSWALLMLTGLMVIFGFKSKNKVTI